MHKTLLALALAAAAGAAAAHDTWFEPRPGGRLALGTGNLFPLMETGIGREYVAVRGCDGGTLEPVHEGEQALEFAPPPAAGSCWVQLQPFEVTLTPDLVQAYFREARPPQAVVEAWRALQSRGEPWRERYVKHARIALDGDATRPAPLGLDVRMPAPGRFQLLRDGRPLAGQNVEFRHERLALGVWRTTGADGQVDFNATLPGRWVLRAIELRVSEDRPGTFDSRFVTLAFEAQNGMKLSSNARSANQAPASAAITSEPPTSTPRR